MLLNNSELMQFKHKIETTNFSSVAYRDTWYREVFQQIHNVMQGASTIHLLIFICVLCVGSLVGTLGNIFFICVFKLIFNRKFNRSIQSKLAEVSSKCQEQAEKSTHSEQISENRSPIDNNNYKIIKLYESYIQLKTQLTFNSNLKILYHLIYYLALVDLFTCLFSVPVTAFELWYHMELNEFSCRLFEFMRSVGVLLSNFLIILIAIEQYKSLSGSGLAIKKLFYTCLLAVFLSVLISIVFTLEISVNQVFNILDDNETIAINMGICLKSEFVISFKTARIINILITLIFIIGGVFVVIVYALIFLKSIALNKRQSRRKETEMNILNSAKSNSTSKDNVYNQVTNESNSSILEKYMHNIIIEESQSIYQRPNFRIAVIVLFVTFIYWLSIIPWCLTFNGVIEYNPFIHYAFLLKSVFNPLIYGFLNPNLRNCGFYLLKLFLISSKKLF